MTFLHWHCKVSSSFTTCFLKLKDFAYVAFQVQPKFGYDRRRIFVIPKMARWKLPQNSLWPIGLCAKFDMGSFSMCTMGLILLVGQRYQCSWGCDVGWWFVSGIWFPMFHSRKEASRTKHIVGQHIVWPLRCLRRWRQSWVRSKNRRWRIIRFLTILSISMIRNAIGDSSSYRHRMRFDSYFVQRVVFWTRTVCSNYWFQCCHHR